jgi:hypothetical protein
MSLESRHHAKKFRRKITGYAACLLPFEQDGSIAVNAFREAVARTTAAGLGCAVNMDTGYANYLTDAERTQVLRWTKEEIAGQRDFIARRWMKSLASVALRFFFNALVFTRGVLQKLLISSLKSAMVTNQFSASNWDACSHQMG